MIFNTITSTFFDGSNLILLRTSQLLQVNNVCVNIRLKVKTSRLSWLPVGVEITSRFVSWREVRCIVKNGSRVYIMNILVCVCGFLYKTDVQGRYLTFYARQRLMPVASFRNFSWRPLSIFINGVLNFKLAKRGGTKKSWPWLLTACGWVI